MSTLRIGLPYVAPAIFRSHARVHCVSEHTKPIIYFGFGSSAGRDLPAFLFAGLISSCHAAFSCTSR